LTQLAAGDCGKNKTHFMQTRWTVPNYMKDKGIIQNVIFLGAARMQARTKWDAAHNSERVLRRRVAHMPSFDSAFSVGSNDKLFLEPEGRVTLWSVSDEER